jgi:hypothetical protein
MNKQIIRGAYEKFVSDFQRQVLADREIGANAKVVAMAISLHFNRNDFNQKRHDLAFCVHWGARSGNRPGSSHRDAGNSAA